MKVSRTESEDPRRAAPKTDTVEPSLAYDLTDKLLPIHRVSSKDKLELTATWPNIVSVDPNVMRLLIDRELPSVSMSKTDRLDPSRPTPNTDNAEPKRA